jgi:protein transport protein SEC24
MSAPHGGYGQYPPPQPGEQFTHPDQGYADPTAAPPPATGAQHAAEHGKKKKRTYAAGAFEVGMGGNAVLGGQAPAGGQFGAPAPVYGGYPQPDVQPAGYAAQPQQPYGMAQPAPAPAVGGYQAPEPYYPTAGAPPAAGGVAGLTSGMSAMHLGPGAQQQLPPQARAAPLNQLYPTDLLNQPFNVSELDLPPPPIILPPNVRGNPYLSFVSYMLTFHGSPALLLLRMRTASRSTCDRR